MAKFEVDVGGVTYEVDAPDENTAWKWANQTHAQETANKPKTKEQDQKDQSVIDQMKKGTLVERYKAGTILYPDEEEFLRKTLQSAASGPLMGAVQLGAGLLGNKELEQKIAKTAQEGNVVGSFLQPEAWLTGGLMRAAPTILGRAGAGAATAAPYGALSATTSTDAPIEKRAESAATSAAFGAGIPIVGGMLSGVAGGTKNLYNTIMASLGKQKSIDVLASDAAKRLAGSDADFIKNAIQSRSQYVPGAPITVGESIAEQTIGKPFQQAGATIRMQKTLSGAVGAEDILPTTMRAQESAIAAYEKGVEKSLAPVRNSILRIANKNGVDTSPILQMINTKLSSPGEREAELLKAVLPKIESKIQNLKQSAPGIVDSRDIYSIRKNLTKDIKGWAKESGSWDKKLGAQIARDIQLAIDSSIDSAVGNNMWSRGYMQPYADKMASVRAHEARLDEMKNVAKQVKSQGRGVITSEEVPQLPNVLSRPISAINYGLRKVLGDANTPVARELARRMADPDEYAKLLSLPADNPTKKLVMRVIAVSAGSSADQQESE